MPEDALVTLDVIATPVGTGNRRTQNRGTVMLKFVATFTYSSASWARMLKVADDRTSAVATLLEYLDGKLESIYWDVETASAHIVADLPDSVSAAAVLIAATKTGAFKEVHVHEVLTQDQLREMVALAKSAEQIYRPPGQAAVVRDFPNDTGIEPLGPTPRLSSPSGPATRRRIRQTAITGRVASERLTDSRGPRVACDHRMTQ